MFIKRGLVSVAAAATVFALSSAAQAQDQSVSLAEVDAQSAQSQTDPQPVAPTPVQSVPRSDVLARSAAIYGTYQGDVGDARSNPYGSPDDIVRSLNNLGGQNPDSLTRGWLAYGALIAAQSPEFTDAMRKADAAYGRSRMIEYLQMDPGWIAREFDSSEDAAARALTAYQADTRRITSTGALVKEQAYSLQSAGWASSIFPDAPGAAVTLSELARTGRPASSTVLSALNAPDLDFKLGQIGQSNTSLWTNMRSASDSISLPSLSSVAPMRRSNARSSAVSKRVTSLAALRAIGASTNVTESQLAPISNDPTVRACINKAQLYLGQCVHAAHEHSEVPFCIGEYALSAIGNCFGEAAR